MLIQLEKKSEQQLIKRFGYGNLCLIAMLERLIASMHELWEHVGWNDAADLKFVAAEPEERIRTALRSLGIRSSPIHNAIQFSEFYSICTNCSLLF